MKNPIPPLPIAPYLPEIKELLSAHGHAVLCAPPGAGKATLVPLSFLNEPWMGNGKIILLEPRRLAARAAARRMAFLLDEPVGKTVGYRIRLEQKVSLATRIEVVTEGILTRMIQDDPELSGISLLIFDEFHERSIHADTGLALSLDIREGFRPDLRLLVMSATLDAEAVARLLGNAPVAVAEGKSFPVETRYLTGTAPSGTVKTMAETILAALGAEQGDILVFLPGIHEIRQVGERLRSSRLDPSVIIAPLHSGLPSGDQDLAIVPAPKGMRKIVLSTSIAETSLTIEGIRVVVDSGLTRVSKYDVGSGMARLVTLPVNHDTADQRRGRAGRLGPGVCYRLWTEEKHRMLLPHGSPEILNADLTPLVLELAAWGLSTPETLSWLDPPPAAAFAGAGTLLTQLGALDDRGHITEHGRQLNRLGIHPRLGHMILMAIPMGLGALACELAALLEEKDILHFPAGQRDADMRLRVRELGSAPGYTRHDSTLQRNFVEMNVDSAALRRVQTTAGHLKSRLDCAGPAVSAEACGLLLAFAYPDRICRRRPGDAPRYLLSNGRGAYFSETEALSAEPLLVAASLDGEKREARIFLAAPVTFDDLERHFENLLTERSQIRWDADSRSVKARREICFGKVVLKDCHIPEPDPTLVAEALCEGIRESGLDLLPWTKNLRTWQARVQFLRNLPGGDETWPDVSDETLRRSLDNWLLPHLTGISRTDRLRPSDFSAALLSMLTWRQQQELDQLAPTHFFVPSGSCLPIDYTTGNIPVLAVRLQEMFGATGTPTIANGRVPLLLHLLSPAGRPVQITRDLNSFWAHAYFDVKKDLMGRYPKHHWPDNPLTAHPTNRVKRKG